MFIRFLGPGERFVDPELISAALTTSTRYFRRWRTFIAGQCPGDARAGSCGAVLRELYGRLTVATGDGGVTISATKTNWITQLSGDLYHNIRPCAGRRRPLDRHTVHRARYSQPEKWTCKPFCSFDSRRAQSATALSSPLPGLVARIS